MGRYVEVNPDKLSSSDLAEKAKGVQRKPVLLSDPRMKLVVATHVDINLGQYFKKLIIREIAGVQVWDAGNDVKEYIEDAEKRLHDQVRATIGLAPILKMPGNYARALFDASNESTFLELIPNQDRKSNLQSVLRDFCFLRRIYRERNQKLKKYYVSWPNYMYLHKMIEHVQEVLEDPQGPGSIGSLSGEGNEAANKLFRHLRKHAAWRGVMTD
ncbi:V(D)J recombination-activating protein 1-like [Lytechinus pictus]|uniref:V(D)J recombination-activating protein 1-like n=1 Tax=Lytechinus pictus TaxID=7653 RepID=UPI0030B9CAAD